MADVKKGKNSVIVPLDLRIANIFKTEMLVKPIISYTLHDSSCDYQKERITIKPNGDIVPCGLLINNVFGNIIKNSDIEKIAKNKNLRKIKNITINEIGECKICKYANLCGGGCRVNSLAEFGDLIHKDSYACICMNILFGKIKKLLEINGFKVRVSAKSNFSEKKIYINGTNYIF